MDSNKQQTAMQDLRDDLIDAIESSLKALEEIKDKEMRYACQNSVSITLNAIISRINNELLEMEKQQIIDASNNSYINSNLIKRSSQNKKVNSVGEQYYNETFNN